MTSPVTYGKKIYYQKVDTKKITNVNCKIMYDLYITYDNRFYYQSNIQNE